MNSATTGKRNPAPRGVLLMPMTDAEQRHGHYTILGTAVGGAEGYQVVNIPHGYVFDAKHNAITFSGPPAPWWSRAQTTAPFARPLPLPLQLHRPRIRPRPPIPWMRSRSRSRHGP